MSFVIDHSVTLRWCSGDGRLAELHTLRECWTPCRGLCTGSHHLGTGSCNLLARAHIKVDAETLRNHSPESSRSRGVNAFRPTTRPIWNWHCPKDFRSRLSMTICARSPSAPVRPYCEMVRHDSRKSDACPIAKTLPGSIFHKVSRPWRPDGYAAVHMLLHRWA